MKSIRWLGIVAMAALLLVPLAAMTANAADFTFTHDGDGCLDDTVSFTPAAFGGTPDSIHWSWGDGTWTTDATAPWTNSHIYTTAIYDTVVMHAWFAAVDSSVTKTIDIGRIVAVPDGRDVNENDSVVVDVLANDTLFAAVVDSVVLLDTSLAAGFGPSNGIAYVDTLTNMIIYRPDANYNGTDLLKYEVFSCAGSDTTTVAFTIFSDGILGIDSVWYVTKASSCACDTVTGGTLNIGDSLLVGLAVNAVDVDEISAGWPKVFLADLGGSASGNTMMQDPADSTIFWFVNDSTWHGLSDGALDVGKGFYDIVGEIKSATQTTRDTVQVLEPIDIKRPVAGSGPPVWELYYDANGDGIAAIGDSLRFFLDLSNEPFSEVCTVGLTLWGDWGSVPISLVETAFDRKWEAFYEIPAGNIDTVGNIYSTWFIFTDNACNLDSAEATLASAVDNRGPATPSVTSFDMLQDVNFNNCLGLGDQVRFRITDTVNTKPGEVTAYYIDIFGDTLTRLGLGSATMGDSTHMRQPLVDLGLGVWGLDWTLNPYPIANAVDTLATALSYWIYYEDDAGNADSMSIGWTGTDPLVSQLDARAPNPVVIDSCWSTFVGGERFINFAWHGQADDASWFRIFWDASSGTIDYADTLAGHFFPTDSSWSTDGTVTVSACRDYSFAIWTVDDCGNVELTHPNDIFCLGNTPSPIADLNCTTMDSLVIGLDWKGMDHSADGHVIYMGRDGVIDYDNPVDTVFHNSPDTLYSWTTADAGVVLEEMGWYDFAVQTYDTCGNWELTHADSVQCLADSRPAEVCVFQPDTVSCYSADMSVYVCPKTTADEDVLSATARGRVADTGNGSPGPWTTLGSASASSGEVCFDITLSSGTLNSLVGPDTTKTIEVVFTTVDAAGRVLTDSAAYEACVFTFDWSTMAPTVEITMVNGNLQTFQPYCGFHGYLVEALPAQTLEFSIEGGNPPYTVQVQADDDGNTGDNDEVYYAENVTDLNQTISIDLTGWTKGEGTFYVEVVDWCGNSTSDEVGVCIEDDLAPCGEITNPVDGKCIRRSRSLLDPVTPICLTIDPLQNCLDPNGVLKVDFQWAQQCCDNVDTVGWTYFTVLDTSSTDPGSGNCDTTFFPPPFDTLIQEIVCDSASSDTVRWVLDSVPNVFSCDTLWSTFSLVSGVDITDGFICTEWANAEDLAWVTQSGTNIYLRAVIYDEQQNQFITECVQVCVDIDTPPMCISSPDICEIDGVSKISGLIDIFAHLDVSGTGVNYDDLEDVTLWYKRSTDADRIENWDSFGSGFLGVSGNGTNNTVWRWDDINTNNFVDQVDYDFRVVAKTIWGWTSWDMNGDGDFDSGTFDANECDMTTWFVDNLGAQIAIDTVKTTVDGEEIVQPNVSCVLSDPRGWIWAQYGKNITVQPTVYPLGDMSDVVKVEWTLWYGNCSTCACETPEQQSESDPAGSIFDETDCDHKVVRINEGANAMDNLVFNPADAPFVNVVNGYQTHVLRVRAWDACGNMTEDCVTIYLLDIDPTDAIVIAPMDDAVFCQDHADLETNPGGITFTARTLMNESFKQATFYYRAAGTQDWTVMGVVTAGGMGTTGDLSYTWFPHALGLDNGAYEVKVVAEDYAGNVQTNEYITTVWLDCTEPTITIDGLTAGQIMGCETELFATATSSAANPITSVCFYYQLATSSSISQIGCDNYSTGTQFSTVWDPTDAPDASGDYYLFAVGTNKAGIATTSEKVLIKIDVEAPWARVIEVNGDGSDGGSGDPTVITGGSSATIYSVARDDQASGGYGARDNCGVDSVVFYVIDGTGKVVYGATMNPDPTIDSLYNTAWNTTGLANGSYRVYTKVWDCACNSSQSPYWYVSIVNPQPAGTIAINEAIMVCDEWSVVDDSININYTANANTDIQSVVIWWSPMTSSDVYDQYTRPTPNNGVLNYDAGTGVWKPVVDFGTAGLAEGLYRVRAVTTTSTGVVSEDFNSDGKFDDFTFDAANNPHHMVMRVDRSVTPFTVAVDAYTIPAGTDVGVTVTPEEECDVDQVCYGVVAQNGNGVDKYCGPELTYDLDPIDSGLVSMNHGLWHGPVRVTVTDPLGNSSTWTDASHLYVIDASGDEGAVVSPMWGDYVTGTSVTVTARKLTSSSVSSMEFFYGPASGGGTPIGTDNSAEGDVFSVTWDISEVPDGETYLWVSTTGGESKRVPVVVVQTPTDIVLNAPVPNYTREVFNETLSFVGGRVDLCLDRETVNGNLLDSVVFAYRFGDAPGVPGQPDPDLGWVRIDADRYGSLCVDWFTNSAMDQQGCFDGRYSLAAWVYYPAGVVNHSNLVSVMVDNTDPYTEIVDIDGDETFGDCHDILSESPNQVKFTAVAIDDRSCAGSEAQYNSGAKYLQFFVGECEGTSSGCVDIVWAIDGSGSMGDDQAQIASQAQNFFLGLGNLDFRMGVIAYTDVSNPIGTDGLFKAGGAGSGEFTSDLTTFQTMVTAVGDTGSGTENGLTALQDALAWYPWRSSCNKILILVTDEDADDFSSYASIVPGLLTSGAQINTVINFGDSTGYSVLAPMTQGAQLDITSSWGANLTALASSISGGGTAGGDVGIIWGKQVTLTDGQDNAFAYWDPSGVPAGTYCAWTVVTDEVGNQFTSNFRQICITDTEPPVGMIAGFGRGESCCDTSYTIYGRSCASDIDHVQFQYRPSGSTSETDWTGIGLARMLNGDSTLWMTTWNPCALEGTFDLRMVPTDKAGNEDFDIQPILGITITGCDVAPSLQTDMSVAFEDKTFENLGLVNIYGAEDIACHTMLGVYADLDNNIDVEKVQLWQDQGLASHYMGTFDDSSILGGGTGTFWAAYNVGLVTYMSRGDLTVYHVDADLGFPGVVTDENIGATVELDQGALSDDNGVVLFPADFPRLSLTQQHFQAWANTAGSATAIRLTTVVEGFNLGKYAEITISYDADAVVEAGLTSDDLTVGWWDGDHWNITDGIIAGGEIGNGKATFIASNLHGVYAVVSGRADCNSGALTVSIDGYTGNYAGATPRLAATVKSNIESGNGNPDIASDMITVTLDGKTIYANGSAASGWTGSWNSISGDMVMLWNGAPPLDEGAHTLTVLAFSKTGYCKSDTYEFTVDATEPDIAITTGYQCPNPTFTFTITDNGSGVNWDSVYVDVYEYTPSEPDQLTRRARLLHTESPDAWLDGDKSGNEVSFSLTFDQASYDGFRVVIYNGIRERRFNEGCGCEYYFYDHDHDGVPDMVGNHTEIVEEFYTVDAFKCGDSDGEGTEITVTNNPLDPYSGETMMFALPQGFAGSAGDVKAAVYDLAGELVTNLTVGATTVMWNGTTQNGDVVAEGVYLIHFQSSSTASGGSSSQVIKAVVRRAN